jgi:type II secretory pathway component PulF
MLFNYTARDAQGEIVSGTLEAEDRFGVAKELRGRSQIPLSVKPIATKSAFSLSFERFFSRVTLREKVVFTHNLSGMLSAGLPLFRAIEVEKKQNKNPAFDIVLDGLLATINQGGTLSLGLSKYPKVFAPLFVSMVHAGEESGNMSGALKDIGVNLEKSFELNRKVKSALMYPAIIVSAIIIIGILMLIFVVPTLTKIFSDFGTTLPASTRFVIAVSDTVSTHPLQFLGGMFGCIALVTLFVKSKRMRRTNDRIVLMLPGIKSIVREVNTARTARTLSSLLSAGVEMTRALSITKDVVQNSYYKDVLESANSAVQRGEVLSNVFKAQPDLYPVMVGEMVAVGEETGALTQMLGDVATYYEEEVDAQTKNLSTIIEPVLMVFIGAAVGFFAVSMIAPMYGLVSTLTAS